MYHGWFEASDGENIFEIFNDARTEAHARAMGVHSIKSCACEGIVRVASDPGPYELGIVRNAPTGLEDRGIPEVPKADLVEGHSLDIDCPACGFEPCCIGGPATLEIPGEVAGGPTFEPLQPNYDYDGEVLDQSKCAVLPVPNDYCEPDGEVSVAPWHDPTNPCSFDFVGPLVMDVGGWESTFNRNFSENALNGSTAGLGRRGGRCLTFDFYAISISECGIEYALSYYDMLFNHLAECGSFTLHSLRCCMPDTVTDDQLSDYLRHIRNVSLASGAIETETIRIPGDENYYARIQFTLCSEEPWIYKEPMVCVQTTASEVLCEEPQFCPPPEPVFETREILVDRTRYPVKIGRCGQLCRIGDWDWSETQLDGGDGVVVIADFEEAEEEPCKPYQVILGYDKCTGETLFKTLRWEHEPGTPLPCDCDVEIVGLYVRNDSFDPEQGICTGNEPFVLQDSTGGGDDCCYVDLNWNDPTCGTWDPAVPDGDEAHVVWEVAVDECIECEDEEGDSSSSNSGVTVGENGEILDENGNVIPGEAGEPNGCWIQPTACPYVVTSAFGVDRGDYTHAGIDVVCSNGTTQGTPVVASDGGVVIQAIDGVPNNTGTSCGNEVLIDHQNNYWSRYCHLLPGHGMTPGTAVSQGQQIGQIGNTGNSTGPHLHFEIRCGSPDRSSAVDPLSLGFGAPCGELHGSSCYEFDALSGQVVAPDGTTGTVGDGRFTTTPQGPGGNLILFDNGAAVDSLCGDSSGETPSAPTADCQGGSSYVSSSDVYNFWLNATGSAQYAQEAVCIAEKESNFNACAINDGSGTNTTEFSVGLFQINTLAHGGTVAQWQDPATNMQKALELFQAQGNSWEDWCCSAAKCCLRGGCPGAAGGICTNGCPGGGSPSGGWSEAFVSEDVTEELLRGLDNSTPTPPIPRMDACVYTGPCPVNISQLECLTAPDHLYADSNLNIWLGAYTMGSPGGGFNNAFEYNVGANGQVYIGDGNGGFTLYGTICDGQTDFPLVPFCGSLVSCPPPGAGDCIADEDGNILGSAVPGGPLTFDDSAQYNYSADGTIYLVANSVLGQELDSLRLCNLNDPNPPDSDGACYSVSPCIAPGGSCLYDGNDIELGLVLGVTSLTGTLPAGFDFYYDLATGQIVNSSGSAYGFVCGFDQDPDDQSGSCWTVEFAVDGTGSVIDPTTGQTSTIASVAQISTVTADYYLDTATGVITTPSGTYAGCACGYVCEQSPPPNSDCFVSDGSGTYTNAETGVSYTVCADVDCYTMNGSQLLDNNGAIVGSLGDGTWVEEYDGSTESLCLVTNQTTGITYSLCGTCNNDSGLEEGCASLVDGCLFINGDQVGCVCDEDENGDPINPDDVPDEPSQDFGAEFTCDNIGGEFPPVGCRLVIRTPECNETLDCENPVNCPVLVNPNSETWTTPNAPSGAGTPGPIIARTFDTPPPEDEWDYLDPDCKAAFPDPFCNYFIANDQLYDQICVERRLLVDLPPCATLAEEDQDVERVVFPTFDTGCPGCWQVTALPNGVNSESKICYQVPTQAKLDCCFHKNESTIYEEVPQVTITTGDTNLANFRIIARFGSEDDSSPCTTPGAWCDVDVAWSLEIPVLPPNSTFTIDGEIDSAVLDRPGFPTENGLRYITGMCGTPYRNSILPPCKGIWFSIEADCQSTSPNATWEIKMVPRYGASGTLKGGGTELGAGNAGQAQGF